MKFVATFRWVSRFMNFSRLFKGMFQGCSHDSPFLPRIVLKSARNCQDHEEFISNCICEKVRNGFLFIVGKVGLVYPPYLDVTVVLTKPRIAMMNVF